MFVRGYLFELQQKHSAAWTLRNNNNNLMPVWRVATTQKCNLSICSVKMQHVSGKKVFYVNNAGVIHCLP